MRYTLKEYILAVLQGKMDISEVPEEYKYYVIRVCAINDEYVNKLEIEDKKYKRYWLVYQINDMLNKIKSRFRRDCQIDIVYKDK